jgi:hypothetical protein
MAGTKEQAGAETVTMGFICNLSPSVTTTCESSTPLDPAAGDPWTTWEPRVWGRGTL